MKSLSLPTFVLSALALLAKPTLAFVSDILPGDFNRDGDVDLADYTVWRDTLGEIRDHPAADGDRDGVITAADYEIWSANYGAPVSPARATQLPEPATGSVALMGVASVGATTRRRSRRLIARIPE